MKSELKTITPEIAVNLLALNKANRPLKERHISELAKAMNGGKWKINGDAIRISVSDNVMDGQHRLHAVLRSGATIKTWVTSGLPDDVFDTIDIGKRRTHADTLSCRNEQNAHRLSASLVLIEKYMTGQVEKNPTFSNSEIEELLEKYPDARKSLLTSFKGKMLLPSVLDACHYLFSQKDASLADEFFEKVLKGIGLNETDPRYVLRERLLQNAASGAKLSKALMMALCIKAWNAVRQGKSIGKLQLNIVDGKMPNFPVIQ